MNEELVSTYFTEGTTRMIGTILCFNSGISKHCSQCRSDFQHQGSFSVLEQHLFCCSVQFSSVARSCPTLWPHCTAACQASLSITNSQSLPKLVSIESLMPSNHLILCRPLLLLPSIFPNTMSQLFASGGQNVGVSASTSSVHPMNTQNWFPLGWTGWISLQSKGLSRVFSNTTVQKHQFFCAQLSL